MTSTRTLAAALAADGLRLAGGFQPGPDDAVPPLPDGRPVRWLALAGVPGAAFWPHFETSPEYRDGAADPLDRWSRRIAAPLARDCGGMALFPFGGPPHRPFLRWAQRAEALPASPLGLRLHPVHGLWHSYRFAIALPDLPSDTPASRPAPDLCARCEARPCLDPCPVRAFDGQGFDAAGCLRALASPSPPACRDIGCLARHACPVGREHAHLPRHARFLMDAWLQAAAPQPVAGRPA